jgi:nitroimidazol reductase NimA-like FMN-containing flavoprotein (pyridoxamine 5'-phosphate oxidase superfamily)
MSWKLKKKERRMTFRDSEKLLRTAAVGHLGTCWNKEPYVVPLNFVYYDGKICFHGAKRGRKLSSLAKNPRVCFEVDQFIGIKQGVKPCSFSTYYRSVIVSGQARLIEKSEEKAQVLRKLVQKYAENPVNLAFGKDELESVDVVEVTVRRISGKQNLIPDKERLALASSSVSKAGYTNKKLS